MKIIRWWGLIAFLVLVVLLVLLLYIVAPLIIKNSIEELATEALGAQVDVASVDLSLFPAAVSINQIAATDPDQPMKNIVEAAQIKFAVDTEVLFWKKIIIDEMTFSGVKTGTARKTSGELLGGRRTTQAVKQAVDFVLPEVSGKDINTLVANADLITLKRANELKQQQASLEQQWKKDLDKNAFDSRIDKIEAEFKRLSDRLKSNKLNLLADRKDWKDLKKSIDKERENIKSLSQKLQQDKQNISQALKEVKQGPKDDLQKIMQKFGLGNGIEGLIDKYIDPQYTPWITKATELVKAVKPEEKATPEENSRETVQLGKKVYFKDKQIFPDLLVKKIIIDGSTQNWSLDGNGFNLGYLPWLIGKPAELDLKFDGKSKGSIAINAVSSWSSANKMLTKVNSSVNQWPLQAYQLMQTSEGQWQITAGTLSGTINGQLNLQTIDLNASFSVLSPQFDFPKQLTGWRQSLASAISKQKSIDLKIIASGSLTEPKIRFKSNLEDVFKAAISSEFKQQTAKLEDKVKQKITEKVGDLSQLENFNTQFEQWKSQLTDSDKLLEGILAKIKI